MQTDAGAAQSGRGACGGGGRRHHGADVAVVLTRASRRTTVIESNPDRAAALPQRVGENPAQIGREANLPRLAVAASLDQVDWASVDLVIECIPERLDIKQALFADLARARPTPSWPATAPASRSAPSAGTGPRERMLACTSSCRHLVPLVEVVMADTSDEASADALIAFMKRCGSVPVKVRQDLQASWPTAARAVARGLRT